MIAGNGQFLQEGLITTSFRSLGPIIVGHRMVKDAVEPGKHAFFIMQ